MKTKHKKFGKPFALALGMNAIDQTAIDALVAEHVATAKRKLALQLKQVMGDVTPEQCMAVLRDNPNTLAGVIAGIFAQTMTVLGEQGIDLKNPLQSR